MLSSGSIYDARWILRHQCGMDTITKAEKLPHRMGPARSVRICVLFAQRRKFGQTFSVSFGGHSLSETLPTRSQACHRILSGLRLKSSKAS